jgi:hypothetical protein
MKQLTLTGTRKRNTTDFSKGSDDYSNVINALWRLEMIGCDRKSFQKSAQQIWKSQYKGKRDKIASLINEQSCETDQVSVNAPFLKAADVVIVTEKLDDLRLEEAANSTRSTDSSSRYEIVFIL